MLFNFNTINKNKDIYTDFHFCVDNSTGVTSWFVTGHLSTIKNLILKKDNRISVKYNIQNIAGKLVKFESLNKFDIKGIETELLFYNSNPNLDKNSICYGIPHPFINSNQKILDFGQDFIYSDQFKCNNEDTSWELSLPSYLIYPPTTITLI